MWAISLMTRGDTRTLGKSDWKEMDGWTAHHEDFEFVLQGEVTETIYPGKAFHCLENKFYLKRSILLMDQPRKMKPRNNWKGGRGKVREFE